MAIKRKFVTLIDPDYGIFGWKPNGMPFANSTGGLGVAHDVLEHLDLGVDALASEILAIGVCYRLRYETGWIGVERYSRPVDKRDLTANTATSLRDAVLEEHDSGRWPIKDPGNIPSISDLHGDDEELLDIAETAYENFLQEMTYESDERKSPAEIEAYYDIDRSETIRRTHLWLRLGYRKANHLYGRIGADSWSTAYNRLAVEADRLLKLADEVENVEMNIHIDPRIGQIRMSSPVLDEAVMFQVY